MSKSSFELSTDETTEPVAELVVPYIQDRESLVEIDGREGSESEITVYLQPDTGDVLVNAEPTNVDELGFPFWLRVIQRDKVKEVEEHPFYYSGGKLAVAAAYGFIPEAA